MTVAVANSIKTTLPKIESAKKFMWLVGERSQTADKSITGTLMSTLATMKFDGSRIMYEHVIEWQTLQHDLRPWEYNGCEWELSCSIYSKLITIWVWSILNEL